LTASSPRRLAHEIVTVAAAPVKAPVTRDISKKNGISLNTAVCLTNSKYATKNCDKVCEYAPTTLTPIYESHRRKQYHTIVIEMQATIPAQRLSQNPGDKNVPIRIEASTILARLTRIAALPPNDTRTTKMATFASPSLNHGSGVGMTISAALNATASTVSIESRITASWGMAGCFGTVRLFIQGLFNVNSVDPFTEAAENFVWYSLSEKGQLIHSDALPALFADDYHLVAD